MPAVNTDGGTHDAAAYRLDGLEVRDGHVPSSIMEFLRAALASDRTALEQVLAADLEVRDLRELSTNLIPDRDGMVESLTSFGPNAFHIRMLAVRGDDLGMFRVQIARTEGGVADILVVARCTPASQMDLMILHDTPDVAGAVASLSRLWVADLEAEQVACASLMQEFIQRILRLDLEAARALVADDLLSIDRREGDVLVFEGDDAIGALFANIDDAEPQLHYSTDVHAVNGRGMVVSHTFATVETLGLTEPEVLLLGARDGVIDIIDYFDPDDVGAALARLDELAGGSLRPR